MNFILKAMLDSPQHNPSSDLSVLRKSDGLMSMSGELFIEVDQVAFSLIVSNEASLIIVKRFSDAIMLMKKVVFPVLANKQQRIALACFLTRMNTTVYIQNRFIGIFGPKANPILNMLILSIAKR